MQIIDIDIDGEMSDYDARMQPIVHDGGWEKSVGNTHKMFILYIFFPNENATMWVLKFIDLKA